MSLPDGRNAELMAAFDLKPIPAFNVGDRVRVMASPGNMECHHNLQGNVTWIDPIAPLFRNVAIKTDDGKPLMFSASGLMKI